MNNKKLNKTKEIRLKVMLFIADKDIFWQHEIKTHLGIISSDSLEGRCVSKICRELIASKHICVSEKRGNNIQYLTLK